MRIPVHRRVVIAQYGYPDTSQADHDPSLHLALCAAQHQTLGRIVMATGANTHVPSSGLRKKPHSNKRFLRNERHER